MVLSRTGCLLQECLLMGIPPHCPAPPGGASTRTLQQQDVVIGKPCSGTAASALQEGCACCEG